MMRQFVLVSAALSLALSALLVTFTPFLREFTEFHIGPEALVAGAFACGVLCGVSMAPARKLILALGFVLGAALLIQSFVIALPALTGLVPNPVSYVNFAEQQAVIDCFAAGPFFIAGGVLGGVIRARSRV